MNSRRGSAAVPRGPSTPTPHHSARARADGSDSVRQSPGPLSERPGGSEQLVSESRRRQHPHGRGLLAVGHVSSVAGVEEVVSAGVDVVAHVPANAELDQALAERMAGAGIVVGPTLATIENTLGEPGGAAVAGTRGSRKRSGRPGSAA